MLSLGMLSHDALITAEQREKKGQLKTDVLSLLKHCAGEVVEATEAFVVYDTMDGDLGFNAINDQKYRFGDELADVITCCLIVAAKTGIDIEEALLRVQVKNAKRAQ